MGTLSSQTSIEIDKHLVLRNIGYASHRKPSARVASVLDEYIENANQLIEPLYSYIIKDIERVRRSCVFIDGSIVLRSQVITEMLKECNKIAIFVATIGSHLEETVIRLAEDGLVLQSAILDSIGSVATEKVADHVQNEVKKVAEAEELCTSRRFSPGYCDWTIRQQKEVFRALDGNTAGIRLTRECLMLPRKSMSGIIGIGPRNMENYNPCKTCKKPDCQGRREI